VVSLAQEAARETSFEMSFADFESDGEPITYDAARVISSAIRHARWAAYAAGAFLVLIARARRIVLARAARILITSQVPEGKGVSSSAGNRGRSDGGGGGLHSTLAISAARVGAALSAG
jgi:galactokinase